MGLLPKTTHPTKPKELRPLGITEISGRAVAGLVQNELRPYLMALVADVPQFAYAPGRSTDAALARVLEHCCSTAALCEPGKYSILDPKFRTAAPTHFTGVVCSSAWIYRMLLTSCHGVYSSDHFA